MNHQSNTGAVNATTVLVNFTAFAFSIFLSILLLKYILYENGSFSTNISLLLSIVCTRYYLLCTHKPLKTHEKACLFLFVLYDRNLLDFFNVFLLLGVECIRQQMHQLPSLKELVTFTIGLIFLLMGWFSVGRILVIYNFSMILLIAQILFVLILQRTWFLQSFNIINYFSD